MKRSMSSLFIASITVFGLCVLATSAQVRADGATGQKADVACTAKANGDDAKRLAAIAAAVKACDTAGGSADVVKACKEKAQKVSVD